MTSNEAGSDNKSHESNAQLHSSPPSRTQLSALMSEAEEQAPHSQKIEFCLSDTDKYLLTVTYLNKTDKEPTWVLSTLDETPPTVFWNLTTENPEQIYNQILKRAKTKKPGAPSSQAKPPSKKEETVPSKGTEEDNSTPYRTINQTEPFNTSLPSRYEVEKEIGSGGMSRVYIANDSKTGNKVAIKVLHSHLLREGDAKNNDPRKRFEQEFKATMALGHDNIVRVTDHGFTESGLPFMVMEYINGHSLEQLLRAQNRLKLSHFFTTFFQTLSALIHAHERGVIHRDVKPSNIMMLKTEQNVSIVKLLDFGIAKVVMEVKDRSSQNITQTGDIFGSPYYMSPEQCKGESLDARSDIYSLGCVMYQALTGKRPFEGENAYKTIYLHVNVKPPSFGMVRPDLNIPKRLESIVLKCLEKDPRNRYQEAKELRLKIERLAQEIQGEEEDAESARETKSGTFYAVHPKTGKEEPARVTSVLKLLLQAGIIDNNDYAKASHLENANTQTTSKFLIEQKLLDNKTLHAAIKCQALIERGDLKLEKAVIALNFCQRMRVGLDEALEELGWKL